MGEFEPHVLGTGNLLLKRMIARMYISYSCDIETGVSRLHKSLPLVGQGLISCMDLTYSSLNTLHFVIQQIQGFKHLSAANTIIYE